MFGSRAAGMETGKEFGGNGIRGTRWDIMNLVTRSLDLREMLVYFYEPRTHLCHWVPLGLLVCLFIYSSTSKSLI